VTQSRHRAMPAHPIEHRADPRTPREARELDRHDIDPRRSITPSFGREQAARQPDELGPFRGGDVRLRSPTVLGLDTCLNLDDHDRSPVRGPHHEVEFASQQPDVPGDEPMADASEVTLGRPLALNAQPCRAAGSRRCHPSGP